MKKNALEHVQNLMARNKPAPAEPVAADQPQDDKPKRKQRKGA